MEEVGYEADEAEKLRREPKRVIYFALSSVSRGTFFVSSDMFHVEHVKKTEKRDVSRETSR